MSPSRLSRLRQSWPRERTQQWNLVLWFLSKLWTRWISRDFEAFGADSRFLLPCLVFGAGQIRIGARVQIGPFCRIGALDDARIEIGDGSELVGGSSLFAHAEGIEIGRGVLMAWNVQIYDSEHEIGARDKWIRTQGVGRGGKVRIADGVWLGANVVVLRGVTIGRNAVVGANSVVTRDIPDYATVAGAPAVVIKQR